METKDKLRQAMLASGMNQRELAKRSGLSEASISRYLKGQMIPRANAATKLATVLHVEPVWLLGIEGVDYVIENTYSLDMDKLSAKNRGLLLAYYTALLDSQEAEDDNSEV